jgi:hypothetical protein
MLEIALVGKPNSGKSSFLKALTLADVKIGSYPFTTIKPNRAIGFVTSPCPCKELNVKCSPQNSKCINGVRFIPVTIWDVAGLVPDAHLGKGMGTAFLDDIRQASCLIHVVDSSGTTDSEGRPTTGHDPCEDVEFLEEEIDLWFAGIIEKALRKFKRKVKYTKLDLKKVLAAQLTGLQITEQQIEEALRKVSLDNVREFATVLRKISKPILIAANKIDLDSSPDNYEKLKKVFDEYTIIPTCAQGEIALKKAANLGLVDYKIGDGFKILDESRLDEKQKEALKYIQERVISKYGSTGVQECLNKAVFDLLNYIVVYPVANADKLTDTKGNVLPDAFLIPKGTTLKEFAAKIHTDLAEKFIGGIDARTKKKLGADYELKNNDVIEVLFRK